MKSVSGKKLCKIIEKRGWVLQRVTGSHHSIEPGPAGISKPIRSPGFNNSL